MQDQRKNRERGVIYRIFEVSATDEVRDPSRSTYDLAYDHEDRKIGRRGGARARARERESEREREREMIAWEGDRNRGGSL